MNHSKRSQLVGRLIAITLLSIAVLLAGILWLPMSSASTWDQTSRNWAWLIVGLNLFLGFFFAQSSWRDERSAALIRLDWFLPAIRRLPAGANPSKSLVGRLLRKTTPGFQSDWHTKKRGRLRRFLRWIGVSWSASPVRRLSQALCLVLFCWLFFYVCWPYHARPTQPQVIGKLSFLGFDQETGIGSFQIRTPGFEIEPEQKVFLHPSVDSSRPELEEPLLGEFTMIETGEQTVRLKPVGEISPMLFNVITGVTIADEFMATNEHPFAWPSHYAETLEVKEFIPAEMFLMIDPLVSLSTAIASRSWVWSLGSAAAILLICLTVPRGFCGYICPLGTTIDLFDWAIAGRIKRFRVPDNGWWVHIKYYLLLTILLASAGGVLISGFFAAIPVVTRGYLFLFDPLQIGLARGWHLVPSVNAGHFLSIAMFFAVLGLGFFRPRFWCKYVCPSGAVFSIGNLFRLTERKVESSCIHCNKCVEICPFDAIKADFTTRTTDCTLCQSCAGVCPTHAIKFVERTNLVELKILDDPPTGETALGRRGFLSLAGGTAAGLAGAAGVTVLGKTYGAKLDSGNTFLPVRPPGSVPEQAFLEMCIRCGECFKACPNNVLQPEGFQQGFEGLWTPVVEANWAGCESSCNACGQVCPTGAIRALPLEEKRYARMGLAIVNETTCLPFAGKEACDLCVQECNAAGYDAIEYTQVGVQIDEMGHPVEGSGYAAPVVLADKCVGCGLCQTRCYAINVKQRHVLHESAIIIEAGEGKEDRQLHGSYQPLQSINANTANDRPAQESKSLNDAKMQTPSENEATFDPFGIAPNDPDDSSPF
ncbi:4Fe-4S binding protein [Neorhodopirellula pilleata]|uniref:4Fe-4S binding protein n=1 Tax=Neorhodopirellula pilleata TaxID=2714738 RepID=UPI001E2E12A4|nr:4Fe-4S binding protein [Neorhodopirellula pilleata]